MIIDNKTTTIRDDFNNDFKVEYNLIKTNVDDNIIYGFSVNTTNMSDNTNLYKEFLDFTKDLEYAKEIFEKLMENLVLPLNLVNVLDEITNWYFVLKIDILVILLLYYYNFLIIKSYLNWKNKNKY